MILCDRNVGSRPLNLKREGISRVVQLQFCLECREKISSKKDFVAFAQIPIGPICTVVLVIPQAPLANARRSVGACGRETQGDAGARQGRPSVHNTASGVQVATDGPAGSIQRLFAGRG
jgi:hypothetical protein